MINSGRLIFRKSCLEDLPQIISLLSDDALGKDRKSSQNL
jgi:hypothetical protein